MSHVVERLDVTLQPLEDGAVVPGADDSIWCWNVPAPLVPTAAKAQISAEGSLLEMCKIGTDDIAIESISMDNIATDDVGIDSIHIKLVSRYLLLSVRYFMMAGRW